MRHAKLVLEFLDPPTMRWERSAEGHPEGSFELLGRAFEVAQRETGLAFPQAVRAFLHGALIRKQDIADVIAAMDGDLT